MFSIQSIVLFWFMFAGGMKSMLMLRASRSACGLLLFVSFLPSGCHRAYYREQADSDAYHLIRAKANHPHWEMTRYSIDVDPRSRMFDPFKPDAPPMPTDDPWSHELMHFVDQKKGYPWWHANGDTDTVENPDWMSYLTLDENGVLKVSAADAYRLALIHSRDYQEQFENLYLSALDVSAERFRFDTQFFGGQSTVADFRDNDTSLTTSSFTTQTGRLGLPAGGTGTSASGGFQMRRGFATGADLAVGVANAIVWNFDTNTFTPTNVLNVGFIQPLLRRAGRDRILEQLTITERALLANVRQMERYRRAFYVEVMTGRDSGQGATRRGGFFGAAGLGGFTGLGGSGFGTIGSGGGGGGGGFGGGGAGAAEAGGYFGLLQDQQDIRNQQLTISRLRSNLVELRESLDENLQQIPDDPETIVREQLQIAQARQALLDAESRLLIDQANYHATLDGFKRNLGLPPKLCVNIGDSILDQFNLIPPEALALQNEITQLRDIVGAANRQIITSAQPTDTEGRISRSLPWTEELAAQLRALRGSLDSMRSIRQRLTEGALADTRQDIDKLVAILPDRKQDLESLKQQYSQDLDRFARYGGLDPCQMELLVDLDPSVFDTTKLDSLPRTLNTELERLSVKFLAFDDPFDRIQEALDKLLKSPTKPTPEELYRILETQVIFDTPSLLSELSDDILDLLLIQAQARTHAVRVVPIDLPWDMAVQIAQRYRRDWMNARASLVDSWRLIEFNADNLEGILDLEFNGQLRDDNAADSMQVSLRFDAPITRLQERNTYRQALIEYQQAKRRYYAIADGIAQSLRNTIRTIARNRVNFEQRRIAVLSAIEQVVLNDQISKLREERGLAAGVTAARDVVSALGDLQSAQNDFLNVWVNYEVQRIGLDLDLGTMNVDPEGFWLDPGPIGEQYGFPTPMGFEGDSPEYDFGPDLNQELLPEQLLPEPGETNELPTPSVIPETPNESSRRQRPPRVPEPRLAKTADPPAGSLVVPVDYRRDIAP